MLKNKKLWKNIFGDIVVFTFIVGYSIIYFWWSKWIWVFLGFCFLGGLTAGLFKENIFDSKNRPRLLNGLFMCFFEYFVFLAIAWIVSTIGTLNPLALFNINNNLYLTIGIHVFCFVAMFFPVRVLIKRRIEERKRSEEDEFDEFLSYEHL